MLFSKVSKQVFHDEQQSGQCERSGNSSGGAGSHESQHPGVPSRMMLCGLMIRLDPNVLFIFDETMLNMLNRFFFFFKAWSWLEKHHGVTGNHLEVLTYPLCLHKQHFCGDGTNILTTSGQNTAGRFFCSEQSNVVSCYFNCWPRFEQLLRGDFVHCVIQLTWFWDPCSPGNIGRKCRKMSTTQRFHPQSWQS